MTGQPVHVHHEVFSGGRVVAAADVDTDGEQSAVVTMHVESGPLPNGAPTRLVDEVLDDPSVAAARHVTAAVPRGTAEAVQRLTERCENVSTRAAGATVILHGDVPSSASAKSPDPPASP